MRCLALLVSAAVASPDPFHPSKINCVVCEALVGTVRKLPHLVQNKVLEPLTVDIGLPICKHLSAMHECNEAKKTDALDPCTDVCKGILHLEGNVIFSLLQEADLSSKQICTAINTCEREKSEVKLELDKPALVKTDLSNTKGELQPERWAKKEKRTKKFAHISDIHVQLDYVPGNNADCGEPVCCRKDSGPSLSPSTAAGKFGAEQCDLPPTILDALLDAMAEHDPDFVIQTGDDPAHIVWYQTQEGNVDSINHISTQLAKRFSDRPVANGLGNHASVPVNQFRGLDQDAWLYKGAAHAWKSWMGDEAKKSFELAGFYTMRLLPKLRAVVLHTTMWAADNWFFTARYSDFTRQFNWLMQVLQDARERGEKVIWMMHHPIDGTEVKHELGELMRKYEDIIVSSFVGHSHTTWFTVTPANGTSRGIVEYCTGGDQSADLNPTFRIFEYEVDEDDNFVALVDFEQFYIDYDKANTAGTAKVESLFRAKDAYQLKDLSPASWRALAQEWVDTQGQAETWKRYARHMSRAKRDGSEQKWKKQACHALCVNDKACRQRCTGGDAECEIGEYDETHLDLPRGLPWAADEHLVVV